MATLKASRIRKQFVRFQSAIYLLVILGMSTFIFINLYPKLQDYLVKRNLQPLEQELTDLNTTFDRNTTEINEKQIAIDTLAKRYNARLATIAPKVVDPYRLVRYFDHLSVKFGSPGQIFEVDSVTISEVQNSLGRRTGTQATQPTDIFGYDFVTVQIPMRVSALNLARFIKEVYDTRLVLEFLQSNSPANDEYLPPLMRLEQLAVTPQTNTNSPNGTLSYYNANATVTVYFEPFTKVDVEPTIKAAEDKLNRLGSLVIMPAQPESIPPAERALRLANEPKFHTASRMIDEAKALMETNAREAQIRARSADLILADIEGDLPQSSE